MWFISSLLRKLTKTLIVLTMLVLSGLVFLEWYCRLDPPPGADKALLRLERQDLSPTFRVLGNNWMRQNKYGLWEMYVQGAPFERGVVMGKLAQEQVVAQEDHFVAQIRQIVPNENYLTFLRYFIGFFNRDLDYYIPKEYQQEIHGISHSASKEYGFIGTPYERILNYHAAHDIGHALQDYAMVGCSSFAAWGADSQDSTLIIGRNFDFYVGDDFARDKIVAFVAPDSGYRFMYVTWGGMTGVCSGMNERGLTVTINAAKSDLPTGAKVPIALLAREILQYAQNIEQAYAIAQSRPTFVSESLLIGSAQDRRAALIEKSVHKIALLDPRASNRLVCTNHYQSDTFALDSVNILAQSQTASGYRYRRSQELLARHVPLTYYDAAAILRDPRGLNDEDIGLGNEKALNQLIAHHAVVFMPEKGLAWVSTSPYQLGAFVCYNLREIFDKTPSMRQDREVCDSLRTIVADTLLQTPAYRAFEQYRLMKPRLEQALRDIKAGRKASADADAWAAQLPLSNPRFYYAHRLPGDYYAAKGELAKARQAYQNALDKEIPTLKERQDIERALERVHMLVQ